MQATKINMEPLSLEKLVWLRPFMFLYIRNITKKKIDNLRRFI